jgi:3-hydroxyacyl-[acyl-carrier-protein] dehydratase
MGRAVVGENTLNHVGRVKFNLLDSLSFIDGSKIVARKSVSLAEEYLADHFPTFPVLPGVMMLEALTQAAGWVLHHRLGFSRSMAVLKEAKNVRYGQFVAPGHSLEVEVELLKLIGEESAPTGATFKAAGYVDGQTALSARIEIAYFDLAQKDPSLATVDQKLKAHARDRFAVLSAHSAVSQVAIAQAALSSTSAPQNTALTIS